MVQGGGEDPWVVLGVCLEGQSHGAAAEVGGSAQAGLLLRGCVCFFCLVLSCLLGTHLATGMPEPATLPAPGRWPQGDVLPPHPACLRPAAPCSAPCRAHPPWSGRVEDRGDLSKSCSPHRSKGAQAARGLAQQLGSAEPMAGAQGQELGCRGKSGVHEEVGVQMGYTGSEGSGR